MPEEDIGTTLVKALGLDPAEVIGFTLEVRVGAIPNLTVHHYAWDAHMEAFSRTITKYAFTPAPETR